MSEYTWAVFRFETFTSEAVQNAWDCIKREFLSSGEECGVTADYDLEYYLLDGFCEIWIPVISILGKEPS